MLKKKIAALATCAIMAATAVVSASLAYFTDTDKADNTFTAGNVKIELVEQQRGADDILEEFKQDKKLMPYTGDEGTKDLAKNYVDKIVNVKNTGSEEAYVRVLVAVPAVLEKTGALHIDWNTDAWNKKTAAQVIFATEENDEVIETLHNVYLLTYKTKLAADTQTTDQAMYGMYLDPAVDYEAEDNVGYTMSGRNLGYDLSNLTIPVFAQAIQAQGFDSADAAFAASGLPTNPWAK